MPPPPVPSLTPLHTHYTESTTSYWQSFLPATSLPSQPPYQFSYPAILPDDRTLLLPIRPLPLTKALVAGVGGTETSLGDKKSDTKKEKEELQSRRALASLLVNHASFFVVQDLSNILANRISQFLSCDPSISTASTSEIARSFGDLSTIVVGVPTLGLTVAPLVAKALGATRYIPLGYSRKFWYEDALSVGVESITSPAAVDNSTSQELAVPTLAMSKRAFLDPNLLLLLRGKAVILIDDVISSGRTLNAVWNFLEDERVGCSVLGAAVLMLQGDTWRKLLGEERTGKVIGVLESPRLKAVEGGWVAE